VSLVLDSSITLAWLFEDERTPAADEVLQRVVENGAVAPSLWRLEVANGLQTAVRRGRIDPAFRDASIADLQALMVAVDPETHARAWADTLELAARHGLTLYDAAYLELARRRRLPLATLDRELRAAADVNGVELLGAR
jgi:predicted nucleic acid-binding protein